MVRASELDDEFKDTMRQLLEDDFGDELVLALSQVCDEEERPKIIDALIQLYESQSSKSLLDLVSIFIDYELKNTKSRNTIFRENTFGSALITTIFKKNGTLYLRHCLLKVVKKICYLKESIELDPRRMLPGVDTQQPLEILESFSERILSNIYQSVDICPIVIRMICNVLKEKILAAYPAEDVYSVLSSFLFLRFFCPAIFDPQNNMKMGKVVPTKDGRRALVLLSKTMQILANESSFGEAHDDYLIGLNPFLEKNRKEVRDFVNNLIIDIPKQDEETPSQDKNAIGVFVLYIQKHFIAIEDRFSSNDDSNILECFEILRNKLLLLESFNENELDLLKTKESTQGKLKRVLSATFLDGFTSDEYKEKDEIKTKVKRLRSSEGNVLVTKTRSLTSFSDITASQPKSPPKSPPIEVRPQKPKSKSKRLARVRSGKFKKQTVTDAITSNPPDTEKLLYTIESLKLQVQMLGERNSDLRSQNHTLLEKNKNLENMVNELKSNK